MLCSNLYCSLHCVCGSGNVFVSDIIVTALSRTHTVTLEKIGCKTKKETNEYLEKVILIVNDLYGVPYSQWSEGVKKWPDCLKVR